MPKLFPHASPRRVVRIGFGLLFLGIVVLLAALDAGAGPEVVTWPLLLIGLGIGSLASQLGAVTVSSVPDSQSGDVGGIQNTVTNLGASIGTALAGAVLIAVLTTTFLGSVAANTRPSPMRCRRKPRSELSAGNPVRQRRRPDRRPRQGRRPAVRRRRPSSTTTRRAGSTGSGPPSAVLALLALVGPAPDAAPADRQPKARDDRRPNEPAAAA